MEIAFHTIVTTAKTYPRTFEVASMTMRTYCGQAVSDIDKTLQIQWVDLVRPLIKYQAPTKDLFTMPTSASKKGGTSGSKPVEVSQAPDASEPVPVTAQADDVSVKRPVGRPKGYPKTGGRVKGTKNQVCDDVKEMILIRGKPVELLCDVARGVKVRVGPQAGPDKPMFQYPSLQERIAASRTLLGKIVPDLKHSEIVGKDGSPLLPDTLERKYEIARRVAFLLGVGGMVPALTGVGNDADGNVVNDTNGDDKILTPRPLAAQVSCPPQHEDFSAPNPALLVNNTPSGSVSSSPEIFPANSEPDALTNDDGDAEPTEIGMTRTYGTGDFSIRCDGPQRPDLPSMFTLIKLNGGDIKRGGWQVVLKHLHRLIGDPLPSFVDGKTENEVREVSRRDERPFKQGRTVVGRHRRIK